MRPWLLVLGPVGLCLVLPPLAAAQEASLLLRAPATPAAWEVSWPKGLPAATPVTEIAIEDLAPIKRNPLLDVDILLGLPIAARVGLAVFRHNEQALLLEGMAGVDYLVIPFIAAGVRYRFVALHTERFELVIKPGVDAYAGVAPLFLPVGFFGGGGDVACVLLHNAPRLGLECGVDLGAIGIFNGGVVPLASFILGFNF